MLAWFLGGSKCFVEIPMSLHGLGFVLPMYRVMWLTCAVVQCVPLIDASLWHFKVLFSRPSCIVNNVEMIILVHLVWLR